MKIFIRRATSSTIEYSNPTAFKDSLKELGPYISSSSKSIGTGLTLEEETILLPMFLKVAKTDHTYADRVRDFYNTLRYNIPYGEEENSGVCLDISLKDDSKELGDKNLPVNIGDYLRYRHALAHPLVGKDKEEGYGISNKMFYIHNPAIESKKVTETINLSDEAMRIYLEVKTDLDTVKQYLILCAVDYRAFKGKEIEKFKELATKKPNEVVRVYKDPNRTQRELIMNLLMYNILKRSGTLILLAEDDSILAESFEDMIAFLKADKNSQTTVLLKNKLEQLKKD